MASHAMAYTQPCIARHGLLISRPPASREGANGIGEIDTATDEEAPAVRHRRYPWLRSTKMTSHTTLHTSILHLPFQKRMIA